MNKILVTITALFTFAFIASPLNVAYASYGADQCQPIYGGGSTCVQVGNLILDKKVAKPGTDNDFVQSLGQNDAKFAPDSLITFQISITNNGNSVIENVKVRDILPQYVIYVSGGSYNSSTREVTFEEKDLKAGETRNLIVKGKTAVLSALPGNAGIVCDTNQSIATVSGKDLQDNAQFCIQKEVSGVTTKGGKEVFPAPTVVTTPPTGPEMFSLIALIPTGALGMVLRKKGARA